MADPALPARLRSAIGATVESAPDGIPRVLPSSTQAVADLCGFAHRENLRIRIEGQAGWIGPDTPADLAISTRSLTRAIAITPADLVATVETGIPLTGLNQILRDQGAWLALDPPGHPQRSLGSVIATGTAGPLRHGYGPVRDHLLGLTVVTGDGRVVRAGGKVVKNVAGYDVTRLMVGSFGAFGIVTELHLRLRALPAARAILLAGGERDALTCQARVLMEEGVECAALELRSPLEPGAPWTLQLELLGAPQAVRGQAERLLAQPAPRWTELSAEEETAATRGYADRVLRVPVSIRAGVFPDSLDDMLDLLEERLGPGIVSAGAGRGTLRWSGSAGATELRELRRNLAAREIPLTLERGPWELRRAVGHFGEYREGVSGLVPRLRSIFDPSSRLVVPLERESS